MSGIFETSGPMVASADGLYYDLGGSGQLSVAAPSKGSVSYTLKRGGSELASGRKNLKDLSGSGFDWCSFTTGTEGDNGSTDEKIVYILDATAAAAGEYTMVIEASGKMSLGGTAGPGTNDPASAFGAFGNGHASIVLTLISNV